MDTHGQDSQQKITTLLQIISGIMLTKVRSSMRFCFENQMAHLAPAQWDCPVDCRYTTDKRKVATVDAVMFEAQPITSYMDDYKRHPPYFPHKFSGQQWINYGYETHHYFQLYGDPGYLVSTHRIHCNLTVLRGF